MSIDFNPADFTPQLAGYTGQGAFRFWCQKVLPIVYDDSLSYYELLNKIVVYLNNVISDVSAVETNVLNLYHAYSDLQAFVNDFFSNLSVDEEINNKLDAMAEDGTLSALIEPFIPAIITDWLNTHITPTSPPVDDTLTISGAAADSKVTGDTLKLKMGVLGNLTVDTEGLTPDTVPDVRGYYITGSTITKLHTGKQIRSVFINYTSPANQTVLQCFVLADGSVYSRDGKSGSFTSVSSASFACLGSLTNAEGSTPDTIPGTAGYYLVPQSVTEVYTGKSVRSVFLNYSTPNKVNYIQSFVLPDGSIYSRYAGDTNFTNVNETSIKLLGNLTDAEGLSPDTVPAQNGYYVVPISVTERYTGQHTQSAFIVLTTQSGNIASQSFICGNGGVYSRTGNTGDFNTGTAESLRFLGSMSTSDVTPDNSPNERGYFICPVSITRAYTGGDGSSIMLQFTTAGNNVLTQTFLLSDGRIYTRQNKTGNFLSAYQPSMYVESSATGTDNTAGDSTGGIFSIYMPYGPNNHIKVNFIHGSWPDWIEGEPTSYKSGNYYRFNLGEVGNFASGSFHRLFTLITSGAWDSAIYENYDDTNGRPTGSAFGTFHGWEKFFYCVIFVDGECVAHLNASNPDLGNLNLKSCNKVEILYRANIYKPGTNSLICWVFKKYTIEGNKIHCLNHFSWYGTTNTNKKRAIYGPMGCVSKAYSSVAFSDYDYRYYNISNAANHPITGADNNRAGVSNCVEYGYDYPARCEIKTAEPMSMYIQNSIAGSDYNKIYFNRHGDVEANDVWHYEFDFIFG